MKIEIINTGTELLLGDVVNTHLSYLGRRLAQCGLVIDRQTAVPDGESTRNAIAEALERKSLLICTGGLGPTSDDISREIVAEILGLPLRQDAAIQKYLEDFFAIRGKTLTPDNLRQAMVPEGARAIDNPNGTAPGLYFPSEVAGVPIFLLPGPPRELYPMWENHVEPEIRRLFPAVAPVTRKIWITGLGESEIGARVDPLLQAIPNLEIGYRLMNSDVEIRLLGTEEATTQGVNACGTELGDAVFSLNEVDLETTTVQALRAKNLTVATVESCTGGLIASRLTSVPGSSSVFGYGWVTYSNEAKQTQIGVRAETLESHGAVSAETAREMAAGALRVSGADFALSVTGIAGPDGGSALKPVGTVWMGFASRFDPACPSAVKLFFPTSRERIQRFVSQAALDKIRLAALAHQG